MSRAILRNVLKNIFQQTRFHPSLKQPVKYLCSSVDRKWKGHLTTMKLETPKFHHLFTPELKVLIDVFERNNYELRIAGGAVRDLLLDILPSDVDFATTATPDQMIQMFTKERIRMFNERGVKHGTISVRINDKENFEVTTLRIDVVTDGRRAEVEFTKDWLIDANRRDLTINAMFLGFDGTVHDYFSGVQDLQERRVQFVGDPIQRIQEDYLRILRYFRFYGRISERPDNHLTETLKAIAENVGGLERISGERIWMELKKILCNNHAADIIPVMYDVGMPSYLGLPSSADLDHYRQVCRNTEGLQPNPVTRMSALFKSEQEVYVMNERLKVSADEFRQALFIIESRHLPDKGNPIKFYKDLMCDTVGQRNKTVERIIELMKYKNEGELCGNPSLWTPPPFPVGGADLMKCNIKKGPHMQLMLKELRNVWKESDFKMEKSELLERIDDILPTLPELPSKKK
ncbi:CCA tRNA nucleotidyltransferase 1, mitochondrial-like [Mizuhopecten yessoensis]|uniref:CCA tRNA nucleotidyltransferase 1, mitochondrial n=1 Tax=Mizuhopecten yessoensis TaxID=6573 RepID=A0A210PMB0_MIZYE|nr:CCA tRNA nucleotidyltransferase 1, mitochondrial-like [Mizuhopecten yessoensis]OWF37613.1 CCA tRNA nucleotidyltransferase 1, mitochondrial [Mizuhopecten yessoensis]